MTVVEFPGCERPSVAALIDAIEGDLAALGAGLRAIESITYDRSNLDVLDGIQWAANHLVDSWEALLSKWRALSDAARPGPRDG